MNTMEEAQIKAMAVAMRGGLYDVCEEVIDQALHPEQHEDEAELPPGWYEFWRDIAMNIPSEKTLITFLRQELSQ